MLLLDTCCLLWLESPDQLSARARKAIRAAAGALYVSAISAFEMAVKTRRGALLLPLPPIECYHKLCTLHGVREIPLTGELAGRSAELPGIHRDPCDRMIIATAEAHGLKIVTSDRIIPQYDSATVIW